MAYDKRLSKSERQTIIKARRGVKQTGFRESEKHLNAIKRQHVTVEKTFAGSVEMAEIR